MRQREQGPSALAEQGCIAFQAAETVAHEQDRLPAPELRLAERAVIVHQRGPRSGAALRIAVPLVHYKGVGVDIRYDETGISCALVLVHDKREFEVTLFSEENDENILAEWSGWSKKLGLPMMIRTENGDVVARPQFGPLEVSHVAPRRARTQFLLRRPRFLRRRETGGAEAKPVHQEREIIARD